MVEGIVGNRDDDFDDEGLEDAAPMNEDDEDGNEEKSPAEIQAEFQVLISTVASCRPDRWPVKRRMTLMEQVQGLLRNHSELLVTLLAQWKELRCSSLHAYRRIIPIYSQCLKLVLIGDTSDICQDHGVLQKDLCRMLARLLRLARNVDLVLLCGDELGTLQSDCKSALAKTFYDFAAEPKTIAVPTAVAVGSMLDREVADWLGLLLQRSLSHFTPSWELALAQNLLSGCSRNDWDTMIGPALLLKVRSHPEKALDTVLGWIRGVPTATITDDWMNALLAKHILTHSSSSPIASQILLAWSEKANCTLTVASGVATSTTALVPARAVCYDMLLQMVQYCDPHQGDTATDEKIGLIISGILSLIQKETKSEQQFFGYAALVEWMVVAKRRRTDYSKALEVFRKPITAAKVGADAGPLLALLVQRVHPDLLESIVLDLWVANDKNWCKGLESMIQAASTRKAAQIDGLIVCYLALLYADRSGQPVLPAVTKVLSTGSAVQKEISFVYSPNMLDAVSSNPLVSMVMSRTLALYTRLVSKRSGEEGLSRLFPKVSAAARAIAACVLHPQTTFGCASQNCKQPPPKSDQHASASIRNCMESILQYDSAAAHSIVQAIVEAVNSASSEVDDLVTAQNASREARESDTLLTSNVKGKGSQTGSHRGLDSNSVRQTGRLLAHHIRDPRLVARVMVLMHIGSSLREDCRQRAALVLHTVDVIRDFIAAGLDSDGARTILGDEIMCMASHTFFSDTEERLPISGALHNAGLSLLISLGGMASNFNPRTDDPDDVDVRPYAFAQYICLEEISKRLSTQLEETLEAVERLSADDVDLFMSPKGTLHRKDDKPIADVKRPKGRKLNEDEEWELQMKEELAKKKSSESSMLSSDDKKMISQQDIERSRLFFLLNRDFVRVLVAIRVLAVSDIEMGNSCLPVFADAALKAGVSLCPAITRIRCIRAACYDTLKTLATCVYEIHEAHAPTIAHALLISCRRKHLDPDTPGGDKVQTGPITVSPLPAPCGPAATTINEMDRFGDNLSGASFVFLFPVIHACLLSPRAVTGCDAALEILERHTHLLHGDERDDAVIRIRKDMAISVLDLLRHDRSQTFKHPTAFETLCACFNADPTSEGQALATSDLAPLLDDRGALGTRNCRVGAMMALAHIAKRHQKLLKSNPLVENRVWLNCFDRDDDIKREARGAWSAITGSTEDNLSKPSPLYAAPLIPLLSHSDAAISTAAADAMANALLAHPGSVSRNVELLCKTYIESVPTPASSGSSTKPSFVAKPLPVASVTKAKPAASMVAGLPKKKAAPKSALDIAGIGKPKAAPKKKSAVASALLRPKQERTLDAEELVNQFKPTSSKKEEIEEKDSPGKVAVRLGVINAFACMTKLPVPLSMDETTLKQLTSFLMAYGIADSDERVKNNARDALRDIVASNGGSEEAVAFLLPHLEDVLRTGVASKTDLGSLPVEKIPVDVSASDRRKEGAVVALGSVAIHLKGSDHDAKVDNTVDMLIEALKTPSEEVQESVADALTKLMKKGRTQDRIELLLEGFLRDCLSGSTLGARRGGAYGLSAAVKGSGITLLKKFDIVKKLEEACTAGVSNEKEGALFAIELLSSRLGLLFEPYVIVLLPALLKSFSDNSDYVRTAASNTVGGMMSKLSAHGVKLVMPAVLTAFNDPSWRTKQASIHMLGAMSRLAPKQLASALPKVVPKLTEAFSDTHPKVKASAQEALNQISTVIRNPEISSISGSLLKALTDPADYTIKALEVLIETEFLHAIDSPSLALITPILHRGLRDRGAATKRYAGLIAGNISTMIDDAKDLLPHLPTLLPDLQAALLDPIPDVRSTASKALGSLTRSLGDHVVPELRPWLVTKLRDPACSSAERSGAAQGLTEVLIASGSAFVEDAMRNEILPLRTHPESSTREGVLWMLSFLPPALGQGFSTLIDLSLPALIGGLSDESEPVRDVAMRAGRVLIRSHGKVHAEKILPSLEEGLGSDDHRIRVASLMLLGDLLSTIGGTTLVKGEGDTQDDIRKAERAQAQIALALGAETRRRVYSGLYMARSDSVHMVRQIALQVWKTVVSTTARALRDILPVLVNKIINDLASGNDEKTAVAGRCLGDVVGKLGDSVLPQIIPVLRNTLDSGDENTKRGVCVGLTEVVSCSTKDQVLRFIEIIVKAVEAALSDESKSVREMAASSFQSLYLVVGSRAFDEIVPSLMVALENGETDDSSRRRALNGLTGILSVRSRELLPYIIPRLIQRPITENHAKALAGIVEVTGSSIYMLFSSIIPSLLIELSELEDTDLRNNSILHCSRNICKYVDDVGVHVLINEIASKASSDKAGIRRECCHMFEAVITERATNSDYYEQVPVIIRELVYRLNDEDPNVLKADNKAWSALSRHVPAEELVKHIEFIKNLLSSMVSDARRRKGGVGDGEFLLPGFNIPNGLEPFIPIYQRGILYGTPIVREVAVAGLGELISLTSTKFLSGPLVVKMTGPLLRIVGDRNPSNVKMAILKTLGLVLVKGGPALRAFVPQFQTTFVKALSDPSRQVRVEAISALALLMPLSTRVDPLIKELVTGSLGKSLVAEGIVASAVQTATLEALAAVLDAGGTKASLPTSIPSALDASKELVKAADDGIREAAAKVMGISCALLGPEIANELVRDLVLPACSGDTVAERHGAACAIRYILTSRVGTEMQSHLKALERVAVQLLDDDNTLVREAGAIAYPAVLGRSSDVKGSFKAAESTLMKLLGNTNETMDFHRALAKGFCAALLMMESTQRIELLGINLIDACLKLAMGGAQRIQFAYNDVLWLVLDVSRGETGLEKYSSMANFDSVRSMKSLHSKVLTRTKRITLLDD